MEDVGIFGIIAAQINPNINAFDVSKNRNVIADAKKIEAIEMFRTTSFIDKTFLYFENFPLPSTFFY